MLINIKDNGKLVASIKDISIVAVFRDHSHTNILLLSETQPLLCGQTDDEFKALVAELKQAN